MVIQSKVDVFSAKQDGYRFFRIPAIVQSPSGYIYAFCEGKTPVPTAAGLTS